MIDVVGEGALVDTVRQIYERSILFGEQLSGTDRAAADEAASTLAFLAKGRRRDASWWRRPLGMLLAAHGPGSCDLPPRIVMELLDVNRRRVHQLVEADKLRQGRTGGITSQSVVWRYAQQRVSAAGDDEPAQLPPGDITDATIATVHRYLRLPEQPAELTVALRRSA